MLQSSYQHMTPEAGCDEAGRGCLAGPVYAAAVVFPDGYTHELLNDSKQLTAKQRYALREEIESAAVAWAVASCSPEEIDALNILQASITAMHRALSRLSVVPAFVIVDGNRFRPYAGIPYRCIVKGDALYASIAAASILAKTYRDDYMIRAAESYPDYDWKHNMGYPTRKHRQAVLRYGLTPYHRKTFRCVDDQPTLF